MASKFTGPDHAPLLMVSLLRSFSSDLSASALAKGRVSSVVRDGVDHILRAEAWLMDTESHSDLKMRYKRKNDPDMLKIRVQ